MGIFCLRAIPSKIAANTFRTFSLCQALLWALYAEFIYSLSSSTRKVIVILVILQMRTLRHGEMSLAPMVEPGFKAKVSGSYNHALSPLEKVHRGREAQLLNLTFFAFEHLSKLYWS